MDLINSIKISSVSEAEQILKAAGTEGDLFEKAHKVGDVHPNGKWVWTEYKPGKFDWRGIKNGAKGGSGNTVTPTATPKPSASKPSTPASLSRIKEKASKPKNQKEAAIADLTKDFDYRSSNLKISDYITGTRRKSGLWVTVDTAKMSTNEKKEFEKIRGQLDGGKYRFEPNGVYEYWIQKKV